MVLFCSAKCFLKPLGRDQPDQRSSSWGWREVGLPWREQCFPSLGSLSRMYAQLLHCPHAVNLQTPFTLPPRSPWNPFTVHLTNRSSAARGSHPASDKRSFPPPRHRPAIRPPGNSQGHHPWEAPHTALLGERDVDPR